LHSNWIQLRRADIAASPADSQERAYLYIKERILDQRYRTGQHLRAQEVAESISLSRTPVREALGRLAQEGLVERSGGWGFVVKAMTFQDVIDLFNVREALEVEAGRAAVEAVDADAIVGIGRVLEKSGKALEAGKHKDSILIARAFHVAIAECSGNRLLLQMLQSINDRIHMVGLTIVKVFPHRAAQVYQENGEILAALSARDGQRLERAIRIHIRRSRELLMQDKGQYLDF
jgi:DNA-binding GntR family transcriptional regulator